MTLSAAYALDLGLGDPRWFPHPVRGLGWVIIHCEHGLRRWFSNERVAGWILAVIIPLGTWVAVMALLGWSAMFSPWVLAGLQVLLLFCCLSTRDLAVESWPVYEALRAGDLPQARRSVQMIVGRDTDRMDEPEIVRGTLETIAESTMDGIVAPLFYAAVGGVPLACVYKAVNTLDSMVGFRSSRYIRFGSAAARIDRWMNWLPAKLTAWLLSLAAWPLGLSVAEGFRAAKAPAARQENSWITEAAIAGALSVRLGGKNTYEGKVFETPPLGVGGKSLSPELIPQAIRLMYVASGLCFVTVLVCRWLFQLF